MKIVVYEKERTTIEKLADKHNLVMEIRERVPSDVPAPWSPDMKYYAHFEDTEVKDGSCLRGEFGNGATHTDAIKDYAVRISGETIVIDAYGGKNRREIRVPILVAN